MLPAEASSQRQRQGAIDPCHRQRGELPLGPPAGEEAVPQPAEQGVRGGQLTQQGRGGHGLQGWIGPGNLIGAQQQHRDAQPQELLGKEVVGAARQQRAPAEQHIAEALAGLEGIAGLGAGSCGNSEGAEGGAGVAIPVAAHPAKGFQQAIEGHSQLVELPLLGIRELAAGSVLAQLLDRDPERLGGILHAGGGGGDEGDAAAVAAAIAGGDQLRL